MTKIEKEMLVVIPVVIALIVIGACLIINDIEDAGGVRQIVIGAGREIKEISKEIDKEP